MFGKWVNDNFKCNIVNSNHNKISQIIIILWHLVYSDLELLFCTSFLNCKMEVIIVPASKGCYAKNSICLTLKTMYMILCDLPKEDLRTYKMLHSCIYMKIIQHMKLSPIFWYIFWIIIYKEIDWDANLCSKLMCTRLVIHSLCF